MDDARFMSKFNTVAPGPMVTDGLKGTLTVDDARVAVSLVTAFGDGINHNHFRIGNGKRCAGVRSGRRAYQRQRFERSQVVRKFDLSRLRQHAGIGSAIQRNCRNSNFKGDDLRSQPRRQS